MTFSIYTDGIDGNFPYANKNNNTQQFRDNFTYIKSGLQQIAMKIEDIDNTVALKDGVAITNEDNGGKTLLNLVSCGTVRNPSTLPPNDQVGAEYELNYELGEYQIFNVFNNCTINLNTWPIISVGDSYKWCHGKVRLEFINHQVMGISDMDPNVLYNVETAVTFASENGIIKSTPGLLPLVLPASPHVSTIIDVWSVDGGQTIFVSLVGYFS
jgi:hypothetical protein